MALSLRQRFKDEYVAWAAMKQRCNYDGHVEFHRYGGRGIRVCPQWVNSFETFLADMGPRPPACSLDRLGLDGNYEPGNCRWATKAEQSRNTSRNVYVVFDGQELTLKELAALLGLSYFRLHAYYRRRGLALDEAIAKAREPGINRPYRFRPGSRL